ncbi:hypothetical protein OG800_49595 (plasmid) [Streptomyces sp. NBC_00445]|uniref:hypothetical protein n=1 Tax=Streptomyces sp. NBC_00445 TaxID=2975745 RepID=UPI002E24627D
MNAAAPRTNAEQTWYLATLGREALLRALVPLGLSTAITHDPLALAAYVVAANPGNGIHRAGQVTLRPLFEGKAFSVTVTDDVGPVDFTGVVPMIGQHTAGGATGLYAELLLFSKDGLENKAAFRLSRMPADTKWITDTEFQPSGHPGMQQPFGSSRMGRKRTVLAPFAAELDRLAAEVEGEGDPS